MSIFIPEGLVTPFVKVFEDVEWQSRVILDELLDRLSLPLEDLDLILFASNTGHEGNLASGFHEEAPPIVTVTSPKCPVSRAIYLADKLLIHGEAENIAVVAVNSADVSRHRAILREGEKLAQQFALERSRLDDWAWRSKECFSRRLKTHPSPPWMVPLMSASRGRYYLQDSLLRDKETRESLTGKKSSFEEDYTVTSGGNSAQEVFGAAVLLLTREPCSPSLEIMTIETGHADKKMRALSSLFALAPFVDRLPDEYTLILPEITAAHVLSMLKLLTNKDFCESFLGLKEFLLQTSDVVNPLGADLAYGWAPGPGEIRHILELTLTGSSVCVLLENDMAGQGFAFMIGSRN